MSLQFSVVGRQKPTSVEPTGDWRLMTDYRRLSAPKGVNPTRSCRCRALTADCRAPRRKGSIRTRNCDAISDSGLWTLNSVLRTRAVNENFALR